MSAISLTKNQCKQKCIFIAVLIPLLYLLYVINAIGGPFPSSSGTFPAKKYSKTCLKRTCFKANTCLKRTKLLPPKVYSRSALLLFKTYTRPIFLEWNAGNPLTPSSIAYAFHPFLMISCSRSLVRQSYNIHDFNFLTVTSNLIFLYFPLLYRKTHIESGKKMLRKIFCGWMISDFQSNHFKMSVRYLSK